MVKLTVFNHYLPATVKAAFLHLLGLSETGSVWDLKTAVLVALIRAASTDPSPGSLLDSQQGSLLETGNNLSTHLLKVTLTLPADTDLKDVAVAAIKRLGNGKETFSDPTLKSINAEWIAHRKGFATGDTSRSEVESFSALKRDVQNDTTVLYLHGGQFW